MNKIMVKKEGENKANEQELAVQSGVQKEADEYALRQYLGKKGAASN